MLPVAHASRLLTEEIMGNRQQRAGRHRDGDVVVQGWRRRLALIMVAAFVVVTACGLCVAYFV